MIFINPENSITSDAPTLKLNLPDELDIRRGDNCMVLSNLITYYTWKNIKSLYRNSDFLISGTKQDKEFELPDESFFIIRYLRFFEHIIKNYETPTYKPYIQMYIDKIENRVTFKLKSDTIFSS